jgi:hypothetical protein
MAAVLPLAAVSPAWAGSNTTSPAPTPDTPAPVITSLPSLDTVGKGGCAQQYTAEINRLSQDALAADKDGLALETTGLVANSTAFIADGVAQEIETTAWTVGGAAMIIGGGTVLGTPAGVVTGGVAMEAVAASSGAQTLATVAKIVALGTQALGLDSQTTSTNLSQNQQDLNVYVATLPDCEATHTGTVAVTDGGVNVTGDSIFNDDVGVAADVNVEGDVNASQVHATQGISAVGGGIWIGDPNGTTYSSGITIGGGAVSGAGVGGAEAFTGDVDAIAIGNNAQAMQSGSLALGLDSSSTGADATAIGTAATANGEQDVVVGAFNNTGVGGNNTVVGNEIDIIGAASSDNTVLGVGHQVTGSGNFVGGDPNTIVGSNNVATGEDINVTGNSNVAIGDTVNITGDRTIAVGNNATTNADDTTVIGTNAQANATGSAAYGQGAVASQTQQQVFGTRANTYTTPGITSGLSRGRQVGRLEVATSDAAGNLATDGGKIFETLSENQAGIAIAMSLGTPDLQADETFGIAVNFAAFEHSSAIGITTMGVVNRNFFGGGERLSLNGAIGFSLNEESFGRRNTNSATGGRVGVQLTW